VSAFVDMAAVPGWATVGNLELRKLDVMRLLIARYLASSSARIARFLRLGVCVVYSSDKSTPWRVNIAERRSIYNFTGTTDRQMYE
jgi:hypothetical protein